MKKKLDKRSLAWYNGIVIKQCKDIHQIKAQREALEEKVLTCTKEMLQGSLVTLYRECKKKECSCHEGKKHGPQYFISVHDEGKTQMRYLEKAQAQKSRLKGRFEAFKRYWELGKQISALNFLEYKMKSGREDQR